MEQPKHEKTGMLIAIVRVRGTVNLHPATKSAMEHLKLLTRNNCVVHPDSAWLRGVLGRCKDHVTFGPVSAETLAKLKTASSRGSVFLLQPPRKGYGRKGIKKAFVEGGALGSRGDKINDLIGRML